MKKPTEKQIKAKNNILHKQRMKLSREAIALQDLLRKEGLDEEAKKIIKFKYVRIQYGVYTEVLYIHSITINKRNLMHSKVKAVRVKENTIAPVECVIYALRGHKPVHQDVFVKAYNDAMNKIDGMLPLIKKTKVGKIVKEKK